MVVFLYVTTCTIYILLYIIIYNVCRWNFILIHPITGDILLGTDIDVSSFTGQIITITKLY